MASDLVYVVHSEEDIARKLSNALLTADYKVVAMTNDSEAEAAISGHQFVLPDAILTPLGDLESGDSILIKLFNSNPLMEQIPVVVLAGDRGEERRRALRLGLLSVILPPYDDEEVALTTQLAIEKHRSEQLLFGSLAQLSVPDLLQTAEVGRRSGIISFQHTDKKGTVWLRDGMVINAIIEGHWDGEEAVYRIALWDTGTFEANFCPVDAEERFAIHPSELLLEAMRRFDEGLLGTTEEEEDRRGPEESPAERLQAALHVCLILSNAAAGYACSHLETKLVEERFESVRAALAPKHPELACFHLGPGGVTSLEQPADGLDPERCLQAVVAWVTNFFELLEAALAWRFSPKRMARLLDPWREQLGAFELLPALGVSESVEETEAEDAGDSGGRQQLPYGCFELEEGAEIATFGAWASATRAPDPRVLVGQSVASVMPPRVAKAITEMLSGVMAADASQAGVRTQEIGVNRGSVEELVRISVVRSAQPDRQLLILSRVRDRQPVMSSTLERNLFKGTLTDGGAMRIVAANDDFLDAFESLFAKSLAHRRHEMLHRFGKKWGLRHALRVEQLVQHEYGMTLREVESQLAIEVLSGSVGVIGLGKFEADLNFRESGVVVIFHFNSPFVAGAGGHAGSACSILAGFHAALLSYLAGRQLAARELVCAGGEEKPCAFVVATEERLTKLFTATTGSRDQKLLDRITVEVQQRAKRVASGKKE